MSPEQKLMCNRATSKCTSVHPLDQSPTLPGNIATQVNFNLEPIRVDGQRLGTKALLMTILTSDINKAFYSIQLPLNGDFPFLKRFSGNPGDDGPPESQNYLHVLMLNINFNKAPSPRLHA